MSVTKPTFMPDPLDDPLDDALVVLLDAAPPLAVVVELLVLLLLLPHAASPSASTPVARATRLRSLILPVTVSPFLKTEWPTITSAQDAGEVA